MVRKNDGKVSAEPETPEFLTVSDLHLLKDLPACSLHYKQELCRYYTGDLALINSSINKLLSRKGIMKFHDFKNEWNYYQRERRRVEYLKRKVIVAILKHRGDFDAR